MPRPTCLCYNKIYKVILYGLYNGQDSFRSYNKQHSLLARKVVFIIWHPAWLRVSGFFWLPLDQRSSERVRLLHCHLNIYKRSLYLIKPHLIRLIVSYWNNHHGSPLEPPQNLYCSRTITALHWNLLCSLVTHRLCSGTSSDLHDLVRRLCSKPHLICPALESHNGSALEPH